MAVAKLHGLADGEAPKAGVNVMFNLPHIDEEELLRRYAETLTIRRHQKELEYGGNGSAPN